ncbi:MAG: hypothetical protein FD123_411 [Bacteroidetes bacterium]|nr:MAG: hypothetical protein FD123_411 [Bacteroidota bacterium]
MGRMIPQRKYSVIEQTRYLQNQFPNSTIRNIDHGFIWEAELRPSSLSQLYRVKLEFKRGHHPDVYIVSPKLQLAKGAVKLEHVYSTKEQHLCIYHRPSNEWGDTLLIAKTIVPWISEWLLHYEIWLITGAWHGGGISHEKKKPVSAANP